MKRILKPAALIIAVSILLSACNLPRATETPAPTDANMIPTFAAQTVQALGTQLAQPTATSLVISTPTGSPTETSPADTATPAPTDKPVNTPVPPSPTPTPLPCDRVRFIDDVTIEDGTSFAPGAKFTKTWELENAGSCTWNSSYALVFANEGNAMNGPASKQLTSGTVAPGQRIQVSVDLTAPTAPGTYKGLWKLRNGAGVVFGIGAKDSAFTVEIKVTSTAYNFAEKYCSASWSSGAGSLPCPGNSSDTKGFVVRLDTPEFETGSTEDEWALWTNPQLVDNGEIRGVYPAVNITPTSHFMTIIGCQREATTCDVRYQLNYKADGGSEQTLAEWGEKYDGNWTRVNLDLKDLAGKSVQFILIVKANGASNFDQALWLMPRIQ